MRYFEVLVEGAADEPVVREVLTRKFGLCENENFRIHAHKGKGALPKNPLARPDPMHQGLLDQLPAKLRGWSHLDEEACVLVLVDVDDTHCRDLLRDLQEMLRGLPKRPANVLFRLAVEETESWFIADQKAVKKAFPKARLNKLPKKPDVVIGAWEKLAEALGKDHKTVAGPDKYRWAQAISPHLDLDSPPSPSLGKLIAGIARYITI